METKVQNFIKGYPWDLGLLFFAVLQLIPYMIKPEVSYHFISWDCIVGLYLIRLIRQTARILDNDDEADKQELFITISILLVMGAILILSSPWINWIVMGALVIISLIIIGFCYIGKAFSSNQRD